MKSCIVLYDRVNLLSFAKIYDFFTKNKLGFEVVSLSEVVLDERGFELRAERHSESLYAYDIVAIPSGIGALNLRYDDIFLSWIKSGLEANLKIGLDLGILLFAGAGFLDGGKATIRGGYKNALSEFCEYSSEDFCEYGRVLSMTGTKTSWAYLESKING
ncbi:hypothetical protein FFA43_02115 [Campylobacter hyointestinalis subsp. hyointestinalis]|uniref:Lipoprotein n=1 Tax=Campylobacter hyointestinalis subsp. hyointestinalis TaxID=91352 RepID=A0A0S4SCC6_CAMHY|nr:hypothetical protein [Campylobacter hyointestinalis]QCT99499.1 hypothetical protein FFA43_02115 [Campylobacter hyointestinalis subsp. hyointestinalis]CUU84044.1 lipoprotein [Campylobacter hyointestinalis subsp. hyointestinalis]CUU84185.1 lipoprotein [Campylobacter hyointestinalis subsp. hyointestinalis]